MASSRHHAHLLELVVALLEHLAAVQHRLLVLELWQIWQVVEVLTLVEQQIGGAWVDARLLRDFSTRRVVEAVPGLVVGVRSVGDVVAAVEHPGM